MNATLTERLENLSPAKRVLLELKLRGKTASVKDNFSIPVRKNSSSAPLSFNQESLFFMERLNPNAATYNLCEAVRIGGKLDVNHLQNTLDTIAARHESLRTSFRQINNQLQQTIAPPQPVQMRIIDLSAFPHESREQRALETMTAESNRPLDLQRGELFKANLIRLSERENFLLVVMHHIISDGWSMGVFWKEFASIYRSFTHNEPFSLPALPIQFGDYAAWSRGQLAKDEQRQTEYWKRQLNGAPALLELPTDRPRPAAQSFRGAQETCVFSAKLLETLKRINQQENATLFMTLLAAFNVLLARYTGQNDLIVGSPIAGRGRTETENLIGFFVNTLALRSDLSGDPSFRQFLGQIKNTTLEAFSHQDLPFEKVVAAIQPARSLSYNPIFQVAFALQRESEAALDLPGLEIRPVKLGLATAKFDLFLSARETSAGLNVAIEYSTDLFDAETIRRMMNHYRNLLESIAANPNQPLSGLQLLSDRELDRLLIEWNDTATEFPNKSLPELFEIQAAAAPDRIAVASEAENLTYRELNERANRIANYLRKLGVRPNEAVGILMDRSALMTCGILGILKAGGAYLPMDSGYPQTRLEYMLADAEVKVILTVGEKTSSLPETTAQIVALDDDWEKIAAESRENPAIRNQPTDLAYIIYTSGSTGKPKGTLIPHRAVNRLVFNTNYIKIDSNDRIAHVSNVAFDAATFELWGALLHGARLVVLDKDLILSPREFVAELEKQQISRMFLTTALFNLLARDYPNAFRKMKTLMFGGEACDPASVRRVLENEPPEMLLHVYGPTETTTFAAWHRIETVAPDAQTIPIGRPLANTTLYVLDENFNPVPVGVPGELFIGGDGLAKGYLKRPELTAEKFVSIPAAKLRVSNAETVRLYRTGDIARRLADGSVEFIGRKDNQIKLRGFRIELGEIESALNLHPAVKETVVVAKEIRGEKKLIAYYVPDAELTSSDLREFLKDRLPNFMIPALFVELAAFRLNANGKIDRRQLPEIAEIAAEPEKTNDTATDELELKLTWIWQKVLNLQAIGVKDNFFELGGHSLVAVRLFAEIEKTLGARLPLATLFQAPTIERLADVIRQGGWQSSWSALVPMRASGEKSPFFCVHAVGGNVLEYNDLVKHLDPEQPFYGLQAFGLDGKTDPLTEVEEMAAAYLKEIRQIQPAGPYFLGGRSFGGTIAYEMARQLAEQGETIALLAIFDSYPKGWLKLCSEQEARRFKREFLKLRVRRHLENWKHLRTPEKVRYFLEKANYKTRKYKNLLWRLKQKTRVGVSESVNSTVRKVEEINYLAIKKYVPQLYSGKATFFSAVEEVCPEESLTGWRRLARGGVEVVQVPGDHQTMIKEPFVQELARALDRSVNEHAQMHLQSQHSLE